MTDSKGSRGIIGRIYGNLSFLLGGKAIAGICSLAYLVIAARALGPTDYGTLILVHGYALVVGGIVSFPGWHAIVRYGAPALAEGDQGRLWRLMRFTASLEIGAGLLAVAVGMLLAPIIAPRLGITGEAQTFVVPYSLAILMTVRTTPAGYLQLLRKFKLLGAHHAVMPVVRLVGTLIVVPLGLGLTGFIVVWLTASLAESLSLWLMGWWVTRTHDAGGSLRRPPGIQYPDIRAENPGLFKFMIFANADATFAELSPRIALLAVGWILGPAAAGLFSIAQRATVLIAQPAQVLAQAAYAEFAHLIASGGRGAPLRKALFGSIGLSMFAAIPLVVLISLFSREFVVLLGGEAYAGAAALAVWLLIGRLVMLAGPQLSSALIALGHAGLSMSANIASSFVAFPLLPLAIFQFGLIGSAYFALAEASLAVALLMLFVLRSTHIGTTARARA
ncbi:MAG: oligosaccharide flippase family protein [Blastomonas fulva]|uniref:lipopolysaccharide biosynthesis protein n=1 Tax=Blastomonas fulva TaxID=1550728 RepID=UPI0024E248B8|nr:oligosaccharide flippase family protein [Blastomonas fulva]MDK2758892.1 oligosaccharide flippase family protein [Blastomonas fulva]